MIVRIKTPTKALAKRFIFENLFKILNYGLFKEQMVFING